MTSRFGRAGRWFFGSRPQSLQETAATVLKYGCLAYVVRSYGVGATFVSRELQLKLLWLSDDNSPAAAADSASGVLTLDAVRAVCWTQHAAHVQFFRGYSAV